MEASKKYLKGNDSRGKGYIKGNGPHPGTSGYQRGNPPPSGKPMKPPQPTKPSLNG